MQDATLWLTIVNLILGIVVLAFFVAVIYVTVQETLAQARKTSGLTARTHAHVNRVGATRLR